MRYSHEPPHEILENWTDEGRYAIAFPCYWDGGEAVICRSFKLGDTAATVAYHRTGMVRAIFALEMIRACKAELRNLADAQGVHLAL